MKTLSILLAEDEILIRADMKEALEEAGHIVCAECDNGKKAIEQAKQMQPELAILDIMMPELNGLETAQMMHELNIPVIMVKENSQKTHSTSRKSSCLWLYYQTCFRTKSFSRGADCLCALG